MKRNGMLFCILYACSSRTSELVNTVMTEMPWPLPLLQCDKYVTACYCEGTVQVIV